MICPRCGQLHTIRQFTIESDEVLWALGYKPVISGFVCDGWCYRVEAFKVNHINELTAR